MPADDVSEAQGLTESEQPERQDLRHEEREEGHDLIPPEEAGQPELTPAQPAATSTEQRGSIMATVSSRQEQFLIAKKSGPLPRDIPPFDLGRFEQTLKAGEIPGCIHIRTLTRYNRGTLAALSAGGAEAEAIIVAAMPQDIAARLRQHAGLVVEPDYVLSYAQPAPSQYTRTPSDLGVTMPYGMGFAASLTVMGKGGIPLENAEVSLYGRWWSAQGMTDAQGRVHLTLFGESGSALRALYVKPRADYWSLWIPQPALDPTQENTVFLTPLHHTFPNFPQQPLRGWGQKAMKVDQLPAHYRGQGVKVAVIDSGVATSHQALRQQIKAGYDTLASNDHTWNQDALAHGTHTTGIIAGNLDNAIGIRGIAPDAEVYAYKIFPEGRLNNLIDALHLCIEQQIDVVNLSVSSDQHSELLEQKIQEAKSRGIACIVAAGNAGGPVQHPASSPHVLAVAAIGKVGEFPLESAHNAQVLVGDGNVMSRDGFFAAKFSCFGPEIGVCAPGVAILSSVPPDNYAVWDGTSMAAPHVTGLASLILAHHADFQGPYKARNATRVERLFHILKRSAQPLQIGHPHRVGAGLPDALKALNLTPQAATAIPASMDELLRHLLETLQRSATPVGIAGGVGSDVEVTLADLQATMWQAGLLANGGPDVGSLHASMPGSSSIAIGEPENRGQSAVGATLADLQATMRQAGLLVGSVPDVGSQGLAPGVLQSTPMLGHSSTTTVASGEEIAHSISAALQECKAMLQQVGLL